MSGLIKAAFRLSSRPLFTSLRPTIAKRDFSRTFLTLCSSNRIPGPPPASFAITSPSMNCTCGCGFHGVHTKSERELVEFLTEEIVAERKAQKVKTIPAEVEGFKVKLDGADVELSKKTVKEAITISFNVNHTVDAEEEADVNPQAEKPDFAEMKSKPTFEVDIKRGEDTLSFTCSFLHGEAQEGEYNDVFGIDEITLFRGEWNDKVYAVAGDVLDGYLYDLLMNFLEEKGVSNEFAEKLCDFATVYEHSAYIGLLEGLSKFTAGK